VPPSVTHERSDPDRRRIAALRSWVMNYTIKVIKLSDKRAISVNLCHLIGQMVSE
jgi:hypothetical protein